MENFELTNDQRQYFGLQLACEDWHKQQMNNDVTFYFNKEKIVKIIIKNAGYFEYDTDINTRDRTILISKRGKEQKLTLPRVLKIKGVGIQFSGSFQGGGIHVYDNNRNLFFIKSFAEEGEIRSYTDIDNWISKYIANAPENYFNWLKAELSQKRLRVKISEGDIIAFKISPDEYGFARILLDVYTALKNGKLTSTDHHWHPRSLIVAPYAFYSNTTKTDLDNLVTQRTMPAMAIFDLDVYRGEMPVIGHRSLTEQDRSIAFPIKKSTYLTIPYTKTDIEKYLKQLN